MPTVERGREELLSILKTRGPKAFDDFCDALLYAGQEHLVLKLRGNAIPHHLPSPAEFCFAVEHIKEFYRNSFQSLKQQWSHLLGFETDPMYHEIAIFREHFPLSKIDSYTDLFLVNEASYRCFRNVLLLGEPGMGKSTYLQQLVVEWSNGNIWLNKNFKLVILIRLCDVRSKDDLFSYLSSFLPLEIVQGLLNYAAKFQNHSEILFVLDGYDELAMENRYFRKLIAKRKLKKHLLASNITLLVSARQCDMNELNFRGYAGDVLRITGFAQKTIETNFSAKISKISSISRRTGTVIWQNPLVLGIVSNLAIAPDDLFAIMEQFTFKLVQRYCTRDRLDIDPKELCGKIKKFVGKYALCSMQNWLPLKDSEGFATLNKIFLDDVFSRPGMVEHCRKIGIIWTRNDMGVGLSQQRKQYDSDDVMSKYAFPHTLFRDYFAACYVGAVDLIQILSDDPASIRKISTDSFSYFLTGLSERWNQHVLSSCISGNKLKCPWVHHPNNMQESFIANRFQCIEAVNSPNHAELIESMASINPGIFRNVNRFNHVTFDSRIVSIISNLLETSELRFLNCELLDSAAADFEAWILAQQLKFLSITCECNKLAETVFQSLAYQIQLKTIRVFSCNDRNLQAHLAQGLRLQAQDNIKTLRRFELVNTNVFEARSTTLFDCIPLHLKVLVLDHCDFDREALESLSNFLRNSVLSTLQISSPKLFEHESSNNVLKALPGTLNVINLSHSYISVTATNWLQVHISGSTNLKELYLSRNSSVGATEKFAFALAASVSLKTVDLSWCQLSKSFVKKFLGGVGKHRKQFDKVLISQQEVTNDADLKRLTELGFVELKMPDFSD